MTLEQCEAKLFEILKPLNWGFCLTREKWNHSNGATSDLCKVFIIPRQTAAKRINEIEIVRVTWQLACDVAIDEIEKIKQALAWGDEVIESEFEQIMNKV